MSSSTILHKRNSTPGVVPTANSLSAGEIAINTGDGKLFVKTASNSIKTFLNADQTPYSINLDLSSVCFQPGRNTATGVLAVVLGGVDNNVSGAGSFVSNGSDNDISGDYAFIGNGSNNKILSSGDFGAILGGQNNILGHQESFILGSNISSHLSGFTYVNNISAKGKLYGDGSQLTGIVAGDIEATTLVRTNSATWQSGGADNQVRSLTANWQNMFTTVADNSATWMEPLRRFDYVVNSPILNAATTYSGVAPGSATNSSFGWRIQKIVYTISGTISSNQVCANGIWTNRYTSTYTNL